MIEWSLQTLNTFALSSSRSAAFLYASESPHTAVMLYTLSLTQAWGLDSEAGSRPVTGCYREEMIVIYILRLVKR